MNYCLVCTRLFVSVIGVHVRSDHNRFRLEPFLADVEKGLTQPIGSFLRGLEARPSSLLPLLQSDQVAFCVRG